MKKFEIKDLVFMAFYLALAITLEYLSKMIPFEMPFGGKLELHVIALFAASFHLGWVKGGILAILVFVTETILGLNTWLYDPGQIFLDYILPLLACGTASIYPKVGKNNVIFGVFMGMLIKYISHVLVGVYYWFPEGTTAWSLEAWSFSAGYNLTYCLPTFLVAVIVTPLLISKLSTLRHNEFVGIRS